GACHGQYMPAAEYLLGQPLRPRNIPLSVVENCFHQGVAARDDVADDPSIGPQRQLPRVEAFGKLDAERRELLAHRRIDVGIAATAARIMAEDGIEDFALAKRKAARRLGASEAQALPGNDEIEAELRSYRALYQAEEHPLRIAELRRVALDAMRALQRFNPYLTGPVLKGIAGRYAEIELQLSPESAKDVELFLLDRNLAYTTHECRRFSGDRAHAVSVLSLSWRGAPLKLSVFDPRDERLALKTSQACRAMDRAGIAEVRALLRDAARQTCSPDPSRDVCRVRRRG